MLNPRLPIADPFSQQERAPHTAGAAVIFVLPFFFFRHSPVPDGTLILVSSYPEPPPGFTPDRSRDQRPETMTNQAVRG
jgi:hypothetical protein